MAICKGDPHNKQEVMKWLEKCEAIKRKRRENKQKLVNEVVDSIMDNFRNYEDLIRKILIEDFSKSNNKELKTWLN